MNSTELLSCPFCGAEADIDSPLSSGKERLVYCKGCFASICEDSTPNSIAAWNRRASINSVVCEAGGWRPIETAPKNWDTVLLAEGDYVDCGFWHDGSECYGHRGEAGWFSESDRANLLTASNIHPTHWQPLPPPPGSARDSAEADKDGVADKEMEPAPPNSLPKWDECALRVSNSEFIAKRVAEGGYGAEPDSLLATELHRFIYEYDDADPYRSAWFLHRLELLINEIRAEADKTKAGEVANLTDEQILACNNTAAEDQEFSPCITAPDEDLIAFARQVLAAAGMSAEGGEAKSEPNLSEINELAKVYASSYASPHHITFTVEGLRNLIAASPKAGESRTEPDLREAAHTLEVAIRFAQHGLVPPAEEVTDWREVMYRLKAGSRTEDQHE